MTAERLPTLAAADVTIAAPPELPPSPSTSPLVRALPVAISVVALAVMAPGYFSGSSAIRSPAMLAFPLLMLGSLVATAVTGRGRRRSTAIDADRIDYLGYLSNLSRSVAEIAAKQRSSLNRDYPAPDMLWTLVGSSRMWERRPTAADFGCVRIGIGIQPLSARLVVPDLPPVRRRDPVTTSALQRLVREYSTVRGVPVTMLLRGTPTIVVDGDVVQVRGLLRAMVCQLAVLHAPDELYIVGAIGDQNRAHWDWLKWLPHNQHPHATDALGSVRMVYATLAEAQGALVSVGGAHAVVIADPDARAEPALVVAGALTLQVGDGRAGMPLTITRGGDVSVLARPDHLDPVEAVNCARRLAAHGVREVDAARSRGGDVSWLNLVGIGDIRNFDPITVWRGKRHDERLRVPIGVTVDGMPLELDIKEPAENGMGPHGLCIGATGSGKSELLRTVALGMMTRNSPEALNLLLIDFKGGATFLDMAGAPHVAAVITNLSDEAPLVSRMRDALAGEMNRRQQLLRTAGNYVSVSAYEGARRGGTRLCPLPTLFIIIDEFSELLSQHPDFADMFVAIGRLGRSLGMHLLLASQRLEEGRLRGLDAHLSYRVCLKTLSASESRTVLGTLDAYELQNAPGSGFLRSGTCDLVAFQTAYVSGPLQAPARGRVVPAPSVRVFNTYPVGEVADVGNDEPAAAPSRTVLRAVLDRLSGQGPPAHRVWLPPLGVAPGLDTVLADFASAAPLTVCVGIVDRPFEQRCTPLMVDLSGAAGHVAVVGAPQSGKTTALRTFIMALAATHSPREVQFYCLDFGGGVLASVNELPHVGAVASRSEPQLICRVVAEMESIVGTRERRRHLARATGTGPIGDVFLVVDGWATLRHEFETLEDSISAIAAQGLSFGVHVVVSASRWAEIRPSLKDQIGTRIELRLGDPAESELDRKQAQQVPRDRPGRGLSDDGLHMMMAFPRLDRIKLHCRAGESAPPIVLLPNHVDHATVVDRADDQLRGNILLGLEERRLEPVAVDFQKYSHLLVLGDNECGKTAVLRVLCREIVRTKTAAQAQLLIVDYRRALMGVVDSEHLGGYAMSSVALDAVLPNLLVSLGRRMPPPHLGLAELRARSWWSGPDVYVVVDDYDLVVASAGNPLGDLLEYLPHARDLGLHFIVARRSGGAARALFEPLLAGLRDMGCLGLMMSGRPDEGVLFGLSRPTPLPAGRGVLLTRPGDEQLIQVSWSPPP